MQTTREELEAAVKHATSLAREYEAAVDATCDEVVSMVMNRAEYVALVRLTRLGREFLGIKGAAKKEQWAKAGEEAKKRLAELPQGAPDVDAVMLRLVVSVASMGGE
jgi:hypothetical protein